MKKKLLKKQFSIALFFLFSFFIAISTAQAQASFDPQEEAAGAYKAQSENNATALCVGVPDREQTKTYGITIKKSTAHPGKFKIEIPNQYVEAGSTTYNTIQNIMLDGVIIKDDGSIPQQTIKSSATTEYQAGKNGVIYFTIEQDASNSLSYIRKEFVNALTVKYSSRLQLKCEKLVVPAYWSNPEYDIILTFRDMARVLLPLLVQMLLIIYLLSLMGRNPILMPPVR